VLLLGPFRVRERARLNVKDKGLIADRISTGIGEGSPVRYSHYGAGASLLPSQAATGGSAQGAAEPTRVAANATRRWRQCSPTTKEKPSAEEWPGFQLEGVTQSLPQSARKGTITIISHERRPHQAFLEARHSSKAELCFSRICGCGIVLPSWVRRAVEGLTVPIRDILKVEYGPVFEAEEVASLTAAFDAALSRLGLVDRKDPMTTTVAKLIIQLAKAGERNPDVLCEQVLKDIRTPPTEAARP